jgi:hypothetical protein
MPKRTDGSTPIVETSPEMTWKPPVGLEGAAVDTESIFSLVGGCPQSEGIPEDL